jgi:alpha-glucosidase (family GH31 glycosyl hydrolase)
MEYNFPLAGFATIKDQFFLGDKYLVAPILKKGATQRKVIIPEGKWKTNSQKTIIGPKELSVAAPLGEIPFFEKVSK